MGCFHIHLLSIFWKKCLQCVNNSLIDLIHTIDLNRVSDLCELSGLIGGVEMYSWSERSELSECCILFVTGCS